MEINTADRSANVVDASSTAAPQPPVGSLDSVIMQRALPILGMATTSTTVAFGVAAIVVSLPLIYAITMIAMGALGMAGLIGKMTAGRSSTNPNHQPAAKSADENRRPLTPPHVDTTGHTDLFSTPMTPHTASHAASQAATPRPSSPPHDPDQPLSSFAAWEAAHFSTTEATPPRVKTFTRDVFIQQCNEHAARIDAIGPGWIENIADFVNIARGFLGKYPEFADAVEATTLQESISYLIPLIQYSGSIIQLSEQLGRLINKKDAKLGEMQTILKEVNEFIEKITREYPHKEMSGGFEVQKEPLGKAQALIDAVCEYLAKEPKPEGEAGQIIALGEKYSKECQAKFGRDFNDLFDKILKPLRDGTDSDDSPVAANGNLLAIPTGEVDQKLRDALLHRREASGEELDAPSTPTPSAGKRLSKSTGKGKKGHRKGAPSFGTRTLEGALPALDLAGDGDKHAAAAAKLNNPNMKSLKALLKGVAVPAHVLAHAARNGGAPAAEDDNPDAD